MHLVKDLSDHSWSHANVWPIPVLDPNVLALSRAEHAMGLTTACLALHQHCRVEAVQNYVNQRVHNVFEYLLLRAVSSEHIVEGELLLLPALAVFVFHPYRLAVHHQPNFFFTFQHIRPYSHLHVYWLHFLHVWYWQECLLGTDNVTHLIWF